MELPLDMVSKHAFWYPYLPDYYPKRSPVAYHRDHIWAPYYFCCTLMILMYYLDKTTPCLYADDTQIFSAAADLIELNENLNHDMDKLTEWLNRNKLQHYPTKTKLMYIGSRQNLKTINCDSSMIKNQSVPRARSFSCLGVNLDEALSGMTILK